MKKSLIFLLVVLVSAAFVQAEQKIGVVDSQRVILESARGKQAQNVIKAFAEKAQQEFKTRQMEIQKLEKDIQSPALNAKTKADKAVQLERKKKDFRRLAEDKQAEGRRIEVRELQKIQKEVMPIITEYGKKNSFTIIFDKNNSGISYISSKIDISTAIITIYDSKFGKK